MNSSNFTNKSQTDSINDSPTEIGMYFVHFYYTFLLGKKTASASFAISQPSTSSSLDGNDVIVDSPKDQTIRTGLATIATDYGRESPVHFQEYTMHPSEPGFEAMCLKEREYAQNKAREEREKIKKREHGNFLFIFFHK